MVWGLDHSTSQVKDCHPSVPSQRDRKVRSAWSDLKMNILRLLSTYSALTDPSKQVAVGQLGAQCSEGSETASRARLAVLLFI